MKIQQKTQIIPTRIKGLKISQAEERVNLTGNEMIPFQEGEHNGKIKITSFKGMSVYVFDPVVTDGKVSAEEYGRLYNAIRDNLLIYTPNASRKGLLVSTEHSIVNGELQLEFPNYVKEEGSNNITTVEFESITVSKELDYNRTLYNTLALKTTGDGDYVLTDNGKYIYIGDLALTNIKIKDNTNTSVYDLVTEAINLTNTNTPCIKWTTTKSGDNIYIDLFLAKATVDQDGIMSKEDKYKLDVTIPNELEGLREALNKEIQDRKDEITRVDGRIDKEISDRISEIERVDTKIEKEIVDRTNEITRVDERINREIQDRTDADTLLQQQIDREKADREKADKTLQDNIDREEENRISQDNELHDRIDLEIHDRTNADISITAKLNKEIEERISEITRVENKFDSATDDLEGALQQEIADRKAGDITITNNLNAFINTKGQPGGLASLDSNGLVPSSQLPSYVDDVLEYPTLSSFPATGETGKIYVTLDTNLTYRWSGTGYVEISKSLALGETSSTAYAGDKGKANRDALTSLPANLVSTVASPTANASNVVFNYTRASKSGINYSAPTAKTVTIPAASSSAAGVMAAADKVKLDTTIPNQITDINNTITEIQDDITGINSGKVSKLTIAGSGNAVTTGSIVGDTLTLTKGATYNNYVHPVGNAPSKATGLYKFSTDATSHVNSVTAVTKDDITALGIPAQDTTYTLPLASASTRGGVKIGYTASGKNYPVQLSNEQMYVNVPWTDTNTNTTYTFANGSSGNFTVTPSGGSAQTVSIGKPATAGTADNSLKLSGFTYDAFSQFAHYGTTAANSNSAWYKVKILSKETWMLQFTIRVYQDYHATDIMVSGYNYSSNHWYNPAAKVIATTSVQKSIEVRFGYDTDGHLWVAVPAGQYTGLSVMNVNNGYSHIAPTWNTKFTITYETSLTGTAQHVVQAYRPWYTNEKVDSAANADDATTVGGINPTAFVKKAGDTMTGWLKVRNHSLNSGIMAENGIGLLMYEGYESTTVGMKQGITYIRSGLADLIHTRGDSPNEIIFDTYNYTNYVPTKTGTGASGTWNITSKGIQNHSISNSERLPDFFPNYEVYAWYNNTGTPTADWWSGITVRAGSADEGYSTYQLCGYVGKSSSNYNPRWRTSNPSANSWNAWRILATLEDNVASATKLQTQRLIFGKYFDGTANVEGQATVYGTNTTATNHYSSGGLQIREQGMVGNTQTSDEYAPRIGFHWGNRFGMCLIANMNGFKFMDNDLDAYASIHANKVFAPNGFWKESDIRLKTNVKPLEHTIEQICAIPTTSFIMNDKEQIGTIAQEIEELGFTEIVEDVETAASEVKDKEGFEVYTKDDVEYVKVKKVEYEMLSVIAIEGVKLLKDEIDKLKAEIETLKNK